ncbi:MAG: hypothetical protein IT318_23640 [Anaerolineales bacterium]|nr:hypothetical protein [Anaerolineales bacterium]
MTIAQGAPHEHEQHNFRDPEDRPQRKLEAIPEDGAEPEQDQLKDRAVQPAE